MVVSISSRFSMMDCIRNGIGIAVLPTRAAPRAGKRVAAMKRKV